MQIYKNEGTVSSVIINFQKFMFKSPNDQITSDSIQEHHNKIINFEVISQFAELTTNSQNPKFLLLEFKNKNPKLKKKLNKKGNKAIRSIMISNHHLNESNNNHNKHKVITK